MSGDILAALHDSLHERTAVWEREDHVIVATPWSLSDGTPVAVYVHNVSADFYDVTDAGQAASLLGDAGVDLSKKKMRDLFDALRQRLALPPPMARIDRWSIAGSCTGDELGDAIVRVGELVHESQMMSALGKRHKPRGIKDRILATAKQVGLEVEQNARMPLRHGDDQRSVNFRLFHAERVGHQAYVQSVTSASANSSYDHARSLFADSAVDSRDLVAVVERDLRLASWQVRGLAEVSNVVREEELAEFLTDRIAA